MGAEKGLVILGFGGNGRSMADVALSSGFSAVLFLDDNAKDGERFAGFPVQRELKGTFPEGWVCMPGSGDNHKRKQQVEWIFSMGWPLGKVVASTATVGIGVTVSPGCFIAHHAHVGPMSRMGIGCIVNTSGVIDHDCRLGDYAHVSGHAGVAGYCDIGDFSMVGGNAGVIDHIRIPADTIIGAGAMVVKSITEPGVYIGIPAKLIKKN